MAVSEFIGLRFWSHFHPTTALASQPVAASPQGALVAGPPKTAGGYVWKCPQKWIHQAMLRAGYVL